MSETTHTQLAHILKELHQVGSCLDAIDRGYGDQITHWQEISAINHRIRRIANSLNENTLMQLPSLAAFILSDAQIFTCWANCAAELEALQKPH